MRNTTNEETANKQIEFVRKKAAQLGLQLGRRIVDHTSAFDSSRNFLFRDELVTVRAARKKNGKNKKVRRSGASEP